MLENSSFHLVRSTSILNSEGTLRKNGFKNMISSKGLKMRMSDIKLSVHLTIEYTISGNALFQSSGNSPWLRLMLKITFKGSTKYSLASTRILGL